MTELHLISKGRIEVITGNVCSGKSEELIRRLLCVNTINDIWSRNGNTEKLNFIIFKPCTDTRDKDYCISRNGAKIKAKLIYSLDEIWELIGRDHNIVAFDEAQFFNDDLYKYCNELADNGIRVIVSGLNTNFKREAIKTMTNVMGVAESIKLLTAICVDCYNVAHFSYKISESVEEIDCDSEYIPLCRKCHIKRSERRNNQNIIKKAHNIVMPDGSVKAVKSFVGMLKV